MKIEIHAKDQLSNNNNNNVFPIQYNIIYTADMVITTRHLAPFIRSCHYLLHCHLCCIFNFTNISFIHLFVFDFIPFYILNFICIYYFLYFFFFLILFNLLFSSLCHLILLKCFHYSSFIHFTSFPSCFLCLPFFLYCFL